MPTDQGIGLNDRQGVSPFETLGQLNKDEANPIGSTPGFLLSLHIKAKLFPEEQILSGQCRRRAHREAE